MIRISYRVALIGCGDIAKTGHVPALIKHPDFQLVALCDIDKNKAEHLGQNLNEATFYTDYHQLIQNETLDAVILALHPNHSIDVAIHCLEHQLHVLDEKPIANELSDVKRLEKILNQNSAIYQIGFVFRYCSFIQSIQKTLEQIGSPRSYQIQLYDELLDRNNQEHYQRLQFILENSSAVVHEGSHIFDYLHWMHETPSTSVFSSAIKTEKELKGPNLWEILLTFADGSNAQINIGWMLPVLPTSVVKIIGPKGWLEVDMHSGQGQLVTASNSTSLNFPKLEQDWHAQLDYFKESIQTGSTQGAQLKDGKLALQISKAAETSHQNQQIIQLT